MKPNLFNSVKMTRPSSNVFDLTHDVKLSMNMGDLVPTMIMECVPGDKVRLGAESLIRMAPMVAPVMHRFDATIHYFFVPTRLVWDNWEKFITNTPLDGTENLPVVPYLNFGLGHYLASKLPDYMGIPEPDALNTEKINMLPFGCYQAVVNEYYRDQNLMDEIDYKMADGLQDSVTAARMLKLAKRCWEHDYFTAALPFAQKGNAVELPLGTMENVPVVRERADTGEAGDDLAIWDSNISGSGPVEIHDTRVPIEDNAGPDEMTLYAKTEDAIAESTTINDLRRAFRLQEWLEKAARGGSRYIESILAHFGVKSSDQRLQRPEYITGVKTPIQVSEILNTTGTEELPQGNMAGHAVGVVSGKVGSYYCEEHGYIIGIMSVMPKTAYQQGIPKLFLKTEDPFQHYFPSFAHIGEQEVLNKEVYAFQGTDGNNVFGYVPRYAEYKFMQNRVAGEFKTSLNHWTAARIFDAPPALNEDFVKCDATHRIFAVTDSEQQKLYCHVLNKVSAVRKMPKFGTPTF